MSNIGIIQKFRHFDINTLSKLKEDLCLSMNPMELQLCASYYRKENRDPYLDELRMLDLYFASIQKDVDDFLLDSFRTDNADIAQTYQDFYEKHKIVFENEPVTFQNMIATASEYLKRSGMNIGDKKVVFVEKEKGFENEMIFEESCHEGDKIVLVYSNDKRKEMETLLFSLQEEFHLQDITSAKKGVLNALVGQYSALTIDVNQLFVLEESIPAYRLAESVDNGFVVRVPQEYALHFVQKCLEYKWFATQFATIEKDNKYLFVCSHYAYKLDVDFLKRLKRIQRCDANLFLKDIAEENVFCKNEEEKCKYYYANKEGRCFTNKKGYLNSALTFDGGFYNVLQHLGLAILCMAAYGCHRKNIRIAMRYVLPNKASEEDIRILLQQALAVYRVQAETGTYAENSTIVNGLSKSNAYVYAEYAKEKITEKFANVGSKVYFIPLPVLQGGLLDFEQVRSLLKQFTNENDKYLSVAMVYGKTCKETLKSMCTSLIGCEFYEKQKETVENVKGILIESSEELPFLCIGKTIQKVNTDDASSIVLHSLIKTDKVRILILAKEENNDVALLRQYLTEEGYETNLAYQGDISTLSFDLLTSQVLILCDDVCLDSSKYTRYAKAVFKQAGGKIVRVCGAKNDGDDFVYEKGLPHHFVKLA